MAMLEYLNCSYQDESYKKILALRDENKKDEKDY